MKTVEDLKSLQAQSILRLNCPGFGGSSLLGQGKAKPLTEYKVIIVNPVSIVHLFEDDVQLIRQVEMAQAEELSGCKITDNDVIDRISQQIEARSPELFQFLAEGGLLIYYLCRPFVISTDARSMDNYAWLCGLAPDQSGESTMSEQTVRHMSTVAHGRNIDKCSAISESEFEKYFDQVGVEWNTIIRTDFLTGGYTPLAQAGPKKCIAGELIAGDNGGRVLFLPAPYSPDFDRVLLDCINLWYGRKLGLSQEEIEAFAVGDNGSNNGENISAVSAIEEIAQPNFNQSEYSHPTVEKAPPQQVKEPEFNVQEEQIPEVSIEKKDLELEEAKPIEMQSTKIEPENEFSLPVQQNNKPIQSQVNNKIGTKQGIKKQSLNNQKLEKNIEQKPVAPHPAKEENVPRLKEGISEEATMADWCNSYWLPGVDGLFKEIQQIRKEIRDLEKKLVSNEETISSLENVKSTLLSGRPGDLSASCKVVFDSLGWDCEVNGVSELVLAEQGHPQAVVRTTVSIGAPERSELARLTESLINFWDSHGNEPKGILVACTFCDIPITQRKEADFTDVMIEFAKKKNICLISTTQLISIYLVLKFGKAEKETIRQEILATAGALPGHSL